MCIRDSDYASIEKAIQGIETLLLISSSTLQGRTEQHKNVIETAKKAGVKQIFYTSLVQADKGLSPLSADHTETEKLIKDSGIPYTIFRNTFYMEFLPLFLGDALETGQWSFPSSGKAINLALRSEMAEALANTLILPESHKNKVYEITSRKAYTLEEIANMLIDAAGKEITYTDVPVAEFEQTLKKTGLPKEQIDMSVMTATTFANGALNFTHNDLEKLLERKPIDLKVFIPQFIKS